MEYERGAENLPVDMNMSTGSPNAAATHVAREDYPHLVGPEWEALQRLSTVIGEAAVATMLRTLSPTEQHGVALGFIMKEQRENFDRGLSSSICNKVSMPCMLTLKERVKKLRQPAGAGPPAGDAVERVDIGHAVSKTATPSESHSHCKKKDDKPNLVILKVNSKRESSLRALVDCGVSNNFVRLQSLTRLDFEEVEPPRSLLEVRLATGVVVRTEKRVVRARFSLEEKKFVDELIVLDLDDKFDMVLGMQWLARHDPVIDWAKRMIVRFRSSDGADSAAHAPRCACDPPSRGSARRGCLRSFRANTDD
ncbi:unnamed protein product [Phytophthora fragariaefolia]|uniref:Unnamed protein product n=1 Tax=Phytophthora fragariaefolia TaxID=1490495 RepID=A0A9W6YFI4_9STRA|nr:unnamed protein product [Phytophthora fragariaefolia]